MGHRARVELVLDCADPNSLATFWREASTIATSTGMQPWQSSSPNKESRHRSSSSASPNPKPANTACTST